MHTRWIETEFNNTISPFTGTGSVEDSDDHRAPITVEVNGRRVEVVLPSSFSVNNPKKRNPTRTKKALASTTGDSVVAPMQGTIVKIAVTEGQTVAAGELVVVLEAMKMEQPLTAHKTGTIKGISAEIGATVTSGTVLLEIVD